MRTMIDLLGTTFEVDYDFEITASGSPETGPSYSSGGEPAEAAEFEITVTEIRAEGKTIELPKWIEELIETHLSERDDINDIVQDADRERGDGPDDDRI